MDTLVVRNWPLYECGWKKQWKPWQTEADRTGRFRHVSPFKMDSILGDIRCLTPENQEILFIFELNKSCWTCSRGKLVCWSWNTDPNLFWINNGTFLAPVAVLQPFSKALGLCQRSANLAAIATGNWISLQGALGAISSSNINRVFFGAWKCPVHKLPIKPKNLGQWSRSVAPHFKRFKLEVWNPGVFQGRGDASTNRKLCKILGWTHQGNIWQVRF